VQKNVLRNYCSRKISISARSCPVHQMYYYPSFEEYRFTKTDKYDEQGSPKSTKLANAEFAKTGRFSEHDVHRNRSNRRTQCSPKLINSVNIEFATIDQVGERRVRQNRSIRRTRCLPNRSIRRTRCSPKPRGFDEHRVRQITRFQ